MAYGKRIVLGALGCLAALAVPSLAVAQASNCTPPSNWPTVHPELPSADQPARRLPIGGYTLALTWAPHYCRGARGKTAAGFECDSAARFGFALHGLWPDGVGPVWPQYCEATPLLPPAIIRGAMCATPSAQLLQHEWAKHGTCMAGYDPARYFARSTGLYAKLRFPDMDALSRRSITAGDLATVLAAANPGIPADAMRITADRQSWLDEIWFCLDKAFAYTRCAAHSGGVAADTPIQIWRGRR